MAAMRSVAVAAAAHKPAGVCAVQDSSSHRAAAAVTGVCQTQLKRCGYRHACSGVVAVTTAVVMWRRLRLQFCDYRQGYGGRAASACLGDLLLCGV